MGDQPGPRQADVRAERLLTMLRSAANEPRERYPEVVDPRGRPEPCRLLRGSGAVTC